ncbi:CoA transferase subunit A [Spirochaeta isovalerica]|uniref:Acetate CoA/acetoacetate CoA-transferase alpha subunit n=1 Tax=Spirochaeta isovalerica TaxID=150 RepID=A0A841R6B9_9SPIO|nr:3-oxoacid CoA-transferase subunit A [Spirochaeta isovalerica]MBB6479383.1 acetate CoA/acetoacetate CoA-transferase alpha subunit [Spirochaeta isovalerica]
MKEKPIITAEEAIAMIKDGDTLMVSGFMGVGTPAGLMKALGESGRKDLTLICSDNGLFLGDESAATGVAPNVLKKQFKKYIASHIGLNKETQRQMLSGEAEVELVPQGTLAERIRSGGTGLGGFLTPTGVGTAVQEGKQVINVEGKDYLLELPLKSDYTLIRAAKADKAGNLTYSASARNFAPLMAMAGETVIVEADEIVEIGTLDPETVVTPGIFVHYIVQRGEA